MSQSLDIFQILLLVGAAHALLLALTLFNIQRGNRLANRIFAAILLVFAFTMVSDVISSTDYLLRHPHFSKIQAPLAFLLAPLFYLYVRAMTEPGFRMQKAHLLHFVPATLCVLGLMPYYLQSASAKTAHILRDQQEFCTHCFLLHWAVVIQIFVYIVIIARVLMRYRKRIRNTFSSLEQVNLDWLRNLLIAVFVTWCASIIVRFLVDSHKAATLSWLIVAVNIFLIGYLGLRRPEIFAGEITTAPARAGDKKYKKSTLTPEKAELYLQRLQDLMQHEKPFLDSDLTLPMLAKKLAMSPHHLSQIINERLEQNFFEFINSHRVAEAKNKIADPSYKNTNLAEIGFEVGFNSISSFNAVFKRLTGMPPSRFRESVDRNCMS